MTRYTIIDKYGNELTYSMDDPRHMITIRGDWTKTTKGGSIDIDKDLTPEQIESRRKLSQAKWLRTRDQDKARRQAKRQAKLNPFGA